MILYKNLSKRKYQEDMLLDCHAVIVCKKSKPHEYPEVVQGSHIEDGCEFGNIEPEACPVDVVKVENATLFEGSVNSVDEGLFKLFSFAHEPELKIAGNEYLVNCVNTEIPDSTAFERLVSVYSYFLKEFNVSEDVENVQVVFNDLVKASSKTVVIGDIHGDMNVLLTGLFGSKMLQLEEEPIVMYKLGRQSEKISLDEFSNLPIDQQNLFQPILNFSFVQGDKGDEIVVLGDILDRGEHDKACLALLMDLASRENSPLKIVMGDHEIYGLVKEDVCPKIISPSNYFHSQSAQMYCSNTQFQLVRDTLNEAIETNVIKFAYVGDGSILYSHSMFTQELLKSVYDGVDDIDVKDDIQSLIQLSLLKSGSFNDEVFFNRYTSCLKGVVDCLNKKLINISRVGEKELYSSFYSLKDGLKKKKVLSDCMMVFDKFSPLWNRGQGSSVPLVGCFGHTNQKVFDQDGSFVKSPLQTVINGKKIEQDHTNHSNYSRNNYYLCDFGSFWKASDRGLDSNWNSVPVYTVVSNGRLDVVRIKPVVSERMAFGTIDSGQAGLLNNK